MSAPHAAPIIAAGQRVRTRIAPSPTGFLHLGTARTALFSWAFARHHGGEFVLRIEDTDVARSSEASVGQILASMRWLGLECDEGPIFQMQRLARYAEVAERLLEEGKAYRCYATPAELEAMREAQRARGEKTLYDGRWRPEPGKTLPPIPEGVPPVVRFRNPASGVVTWDDLVKGPITIANHEIDDLVIVRADGIPTYNFAVVVDDHDMRISHVFRGDEHVNNTPWQINIFAALGTPCPEFAHVPIILGSDGHKLSKRRGAVSVTAYEEKGYLPEAMLNYLARLGWSHGDEEIFAREQMIAWFDGSHLSKSPAQWDPAKLDWVNAHYLRALDPPRLLALATSQLTRRGIGAPSEAALLRACAVFKDRCSTGAELADWLAVVFADVAPSADDIATHVTESVRPALATLRHKLGAVSWDKAAIAAAVKETLVAHGLKMAQLAPAVRVLVCGRAQTPSLDTVLEVFDRATVLARLAPA
ncbi:MAG: glutamate--tRNA ligase [Pseudomonadota bacterium]|nr:glutamate--tRNA ligase [Pseudomonadota bacterium]